jgi:hypothetical protein
MISTYGIDEELGYIRLALASSSKKAPAGRLRLSVRLAWKEAADFRHSAFRLASP